MLKVGFYQQELIIYMIIANSIFIYAKNKMK